MDVIWAQNPFHIKSTNNNDAKQSRGIGFGLIGAVAQATSEGGFSFDNVEWGTVGTAALTGAAGGALIGSGVGAIGAAVTAGTALTVAGTAVVGAAMTTGSGILARTITTAADPESDATAIIEAATDPESLTADTLAGAFAGIGFGTSGLVASLLKPAQTTLQSAISTVAPSIAGGFTEGSAYSVVDQYVKEGEVDPAEVLKTGALSALFAGAFSFLGAIGNSAKSSPKNTKGPGGQGKGSGSVKGEGRTLPQGLTPETHSAASRLIKRYRR